MLNFYGIIIAFASFFVIGIFHTIVIKGEYYFSEKIWPVFLATGILFCAVSIFTSGIVSVLCALIGGACLWSIRELKEQRKRVQKDRFPQNKKRSQNASAQGKISEAIIIRPIQKKDNGQLSSINPRNIWRVRSTKRKFRLFRQGNRFSFWNIQRK